MERPSWYAIQWALLGAATLAGLALLAANPQPRVDSLTWRWPGTGHVAFPTATPVTSLYGEPVYRLGQVVAGWEKAPGRWVGRTILVGTEAALACDVWSYDRTVRITSYTTSCSVGDSPIMLTDPYGGVAIPTGSSDRPGFPLEGYIASSYFGALPPPTPTPTPIFTVRLASRPDCGWLEPGRHPCLVAEPVSWSIP